MIHSLVILTTLPLNRISPTQNKTKQKIKQKNKKENPSVGKRKFWVWNLFKKLCENKKACVHISKFTELGKPEQNFKTNLLSKVAMLPIHYNNNNCDTLNQCHNLFENQTKSTNLNFTKNTQTHKSPKNPNQNKTVDKFPKTYSFKTAPMQMCLYLLVFL